MPLTKRKERVRLMSGGPTMNRLVIAGAVAAAALAALPVLAQNYNRNPAFGTFRLSADFRPDPFVINVRAGGRIAASSLSPQCQGTIADAPDVRINYTAGRFPLSFTVRSGSDTTLVVNDPSGAWYCDDDSGGNLDPRVVFTSPKAGQYDIWIGHYEGGSGVRAQLLVSEM